MEIDPHQMEAENSKMQEHLEKTINGGKINEIVTCDFILFHLNICVPPREETSKFQSLGNAGEENQMKKSGMAHREDTFRTVNHASEWNDDKHLKHQIIVKLHYPLSKENTKRQSEMDTKSVGTVKIGNSEFKGVNTALTLWWCWALSRCTEFL